MANRLRGEAAFVLDGTEHRIVLDAEAMLNAEDMAGIGLLSLVERLDSIRVLAALLAAGLSSASGKPVGLTAAAEMLLASDAPRGALLAALTQALPAPAREEAGADATVNPPPPVNGTGSSS